MRLFERVSRPPARPTTTHRADREAGRDIERERQAVFFQQRIGQRIEPVSSRHKGDTERNGA